MGGIGGRCAGAVKCYVKIIQNSVRCVFLLRIRGKIIRDNRQMKNMCQINKVPLFNNDKFG